MLAPHPLYQLRLASTHDGDTHHDVIATASGVRECDRGELFDLLASHVPHMRDRLSLTVADSVLCEPARVPDVAVCLARMAIAATWDEAVAAHERAA
jgi:hypothetical protein